MKFNDLLINSIKKRGNLCVGLDSRHDRLPDFIKKNKSISQTVFDFNRKIIEMTHDLVAAYKMNLAFYAGFGSEGLEGLRLTNKFLKENYPQIPIFADCKRSEMGESVGMVKKEIFDWLLFDCVMVTPWFGFDTVRDYLDDEEHGVCVYVHDSNPSAVEFQDLELKDGRRVYEEVARKVAREWNNNGNVIVEAGATYPVQLMRVRKIVGLEMVILTAGVGAQGAKPEDLRGIFGTNGQRLLVNSSRGIIFAGAGKKDYFGEVRKASVQLKDKLNQLSNL